MNFPAKAVNPAKAVKAPVPPAQCQKPQRKAIHARGRLALHEEAMKVEGLGLVGGGQRDRKRHDCVRP